MKLANTIWKAPRGSCSGRSTRPSIERPWRLSSGLSERGQRQMCDLLASAVNVDAVYEQAGWADVCELDSQGKVISDISARAVDYRSCSSIRTQSQAAAEEAAAAAAAAAAEAAAAAATIFRCLHVFRRPLPATYARSRGRTEQNANKADRDVHDFRCKLTTCNCQELHTPTKHVLYSY